MPELPLPDLLLPQGVGWPIALALVVIAFFTSALTAAFGIGGGVAMLGALAGTVPPSVIVAVHGIVQLGSNIGRAILQRRHALWRFVAIFSAGSLIGAVGGAALFVALPERVLLGALGVFILVMVWWPKASIPGLSSAGLLLGGIFSTFLSIFVGATGPFVQAVLLKLAADRKQLIATHAACMSVQHGLKVAAFGVLGFSFTDWLPLLAAMIAAGFAGTLLGTRLLEAMPERLFTTIVKALLTIVAAELLRRAAGY
jgi:uncharacterized membrane protein YfcA